MRYVSLATVFAFYAITSNAYATAIDQPYPIGNFSLPRSQRPGADYSFGSTIIDAGQAQIHVVPDIFKATRQRFFDYSLRLLYGTTDHTSLLLELPMSTVTTRDVHNKSGFDNFTIQGDYEFYNHPSSTDIEKASLIGSFSPPTGDLGTRACTYFIGSVYNHSWSEWMWYAAPGISQFIKHNGEQPAPRVYYELGVGRNISSETGRYIVTGFLEINGQYDPRIFTSHPVTHSSGGSVLSNGHLLFFSPSLFFSNPQWLFQIGVSLPITQHWLGTRDKVDYATAAGIAYTIN